jgi:NAD(P)-dependent dehydrogenase (short-subunit alcohol dehydrogenase family)
MSGAVIIGVGPGIGRSVAVRLAKEGLPIGLIARSEANLHAVADEVAAVGVPVLAVPADSTDQDGQNAALDRFIDRYGVPGVLVHNTARIRADRPGELSVQGHMEAWAVNVVGALNAAAHVAPAMAERGNGTIIITGGMPEPKPQYVSLSLGKAGVRTLVTLLDQEYGPAGVHVASVTVAGAVAPGTAFDPDDIAEHYWRLHTQPRDRWEHEVLYAGRT